MNQKGKKKFAIYQENNGYVETLILLLFARNMINILIFSKMSQKDIPLIRRPQLLRWVEHKKAAQRGGPEAASGIVRYGRCEP